MVPHDNFGRRQWHPTPVLLPGNSHGRRSLVGCSPWSREESDTTERLHFHFSLSCIGEGKGNPLRCSRLENPRDGEAWWAAIYGVAQSRTWLKWLSSSSSIILVWTSLITNDVIVAYLYIFYMPFIYLLWSTCWSLLPIKKNQLCVLSPLSDMGFCKYFLPVCVVFLFILSTVFSKEQF